MPEVFNCPFIQRNQKVYFIHDSPDWYCTDTDCCGICPAADTGHVFPGCENMIPATLQNFYQKLFNGLDSRSCLATEYDGDITGYVQEMFFFHIELSRIVFLSMIILSGRYRVIPVDRGVFQFGLKHRCNGADMDILLREGDFYAGFTESLVDSKVSCVPDGEVTV